MYTLTKDTLGAFDYPVINFTTSKCGKFMFIDNFNRFGEVHHEQVFELVQARELWTNLLKDGYTYTK